MNPNILQTKMEALHGIRQQEIDILALFAAKKAVFDAENKFTVETLAAVKKLKAELETELKEQSILTYKATPKDERTKQILGGAVVIGCGTKTTFDYDEAEALEWAKKKALCLKLDIGAFEGICGTASKPDFVKVEEVPTITAKVKSDFSPYITKPEPVEVVSDGEPFGE
jgi:hypothetical protein